MDMLNVLYSIRMELTFHHQTDNNISHQSPETMRSVQNVTDDWEPTGNSVKGGHTWQRPHINTAKRQPMFYWSEMTL